MRRHGWHLAPLAVIALLLVTADAHATRFRPGPEARAVAWGAPLLSINRVVAWLVSPFFAPPPSRAIVDDALAMTPLAREHGWTALRFDLAGDGLGVYLAVDGEAEFDVAYVDYTDGTQDRFELARAQRSDGVFALAEYDRERVVAHVSLLARAVSPQARVAVLLGR